MKTADEIQHIVIKVLADLAEEYGFECPDLNCDTKPMVDVRGLDSLHCVELIVAISEHVHVDTDNEVFWDEDGVFRTIGEVASYLRDRQCEEAA